MTLVHTEYMDRTVSTDVEAVRLRVRVQLAASPNPAEWDETSRDRLWLLGELTRLLRLSNPQPKPVLNGVPKHFEYTGTPCQYCGSCNVKRTGNCSVCENCGESGGCS